MKANALRQTLFPRAVTAQGAKFEPRRRVEVVDDAGRVVARIEETLYVRKRTERGHLLS